MNTPASTKELRQQLDELGFGDVFIQDNERYKREEVKLPFGDVVTIYYYLDEVFPTRADALEEYILKVFELSIANVKEMWVEIGLLNFPYDETWLEDDVDNSKYH